VWPIVERGDEWHGESVGLRSDGSSFPQELSLSPLDDGGLVCVVRDVTERKAAERELERQNRRLEQFASVVSHELRGPLNIAQGNVGLARTADDVDDPLDTIETALGRMERTIDDTLSFALGVDGVEDPTVVSLERTVPDCWHRSDEQVVVVDDLRFVADRDLLQRLFENLFRNSVEHGSTGTRTATQPDDVQRQSTAGRATAAANGGEATSGVASNGSTATPETSVQVRVGPLSDGRGFFVEDDGPGVPPEERDAVFEPGYSTSSSGTGLGLDIVRRIAHKHGWDCRLTAGRDEGARFEFPGVDVVETDREDD
jgi:signal transduction histidine kinase